MITIVRPWQNCGYYSFTTNKKQPRVTKVKAWFILKRKSSVASSVVNSLLAAEKPLVSHSF